MKVIKNIGMLILTKLSCQKYKEQSTWLYQNHRYCVDPSLKFILPTCPMTYDTSSVLKYYALKLAQIFLSKLKENKNVRRKHQPL